MRRADPKPAHCSVCLQAPSVRDPQLEFVDFEASWDGPVITRNGEEVSPEQFAPVPIDDLIVCEECLRSAAKLIGMEQAEELRARVAELEGTVTERDVEIKAKDSMISHLEKTVGEAIDHPVKRPQGKPTFKGPESHDAELAQMRKARAARGKKKKEPVA